MAATKTRSHLWIVAALAGAAAIWLVLWRVVGVSSPRADAPVDRANLETRASDASVPELTAQEPAQAVPVERSASSTPATSPAPIEPKIRLYGSLLDARDRTTLTCSCSLRAADEAWTERTLTTGGDGSYAFTDLHPGTWEITVREPSLQTLRIRVELRAEEPEKQLDLFLHPAVVVKVRVAGAAGEDLQMTSSGGHLAINGLREELRRAAGTLEERLRARGFPSAVALTVVATRTEPGRWYRGDATNEPRVGRFIDRQARLADREIPGLLSKPLRDGTRLGDLPPAYCGVIELAEPPPAFASLVVHDFVLRTVPIPPAVDEIAFSITRDELKQLPGQVRVKVLDAVEGAAPRGTQVRLNEPVPREAEPSLDENGSITFENVLPGWANLTITAPEREAILEHVLVQPGVLTDLGTYRMQPFSEIRATVLDEDGAPARVQFNVFPLDRYEAARESLASHIFRSSPDGELKIDSVGRDRYVIVANDDSWTSVPTLADTTFRQTERVEIRVAKGVDVALRLRGEPPPGALLSIRTSTGLPVSDTTCREGETVRLHLAPGKYSAELRDGDTWLWTEGFSVGKEPLRRYLPR